MKVKPDRSVVHGCASSVCVMMQVFQYKIIQEADVICVGTVNGVHVTVTIRVKDAVDECLIDRRWLDWNPAEMTPKAYERHIGSLGAAKQKRKS